MIFETFERTTYIFQQDNAPTYDNIYLMLFCGTEKTSTIIL